MCCSPLSQQLSARGVQGSAAGGVRGAIHQQGGSDWTHIIILVSLISGATEDHFRLKEELECTHKGFFGVLMQGLQRGLPFICPCSRNVGVRICWDTSGTWHCSPLCFLKHLLWDKRQAAREGCRKWWEMLSSDTLKGQKHEGVEKDCSYPKPAQALKLS